MVTFGIVGNGWRAQFFQRLSLLLPDELELVGAAVRRAEAAEDVRDHWQVPVYLSPAELLHGAHPDFVVTCVPWAANPAVVTDIAVAGTKVLSETPPAPDIDGLRSLWDDVGGQDLVHVAEQYQLMPMHAARAEIVRRGLIGAATQVQVSSTHTYHAVSLIRGLLGAGLAPARVSATALCGPLVDPLTRAGWTDDASAKNATATIATLNFGDGRSAVYDFTDNQWHNQLRHSRILVRGTHGEIADERVVRLAAARTIVHSPIVRQQLGYDLDLDGYDTELVTFEGDVLWRNPFLGRRLMDEEIAITELLRRTLRWAADEAAGPYSLADANQDHLIGLAVEESIAKGRAVDTTVEAWAATLGQRPS